MELMQAIRERHSVRMFKNQQVPEEVISEMLEAARLAPSGGNAQGWRLGVVDDPATIHQLAEAAGNQLWIATAPLVIACCAELSWDMGSVPPDDFGLEVNILRFGKGMVDYLNDYPDRRAVCMVMENATPLIPAEHMFLTAVSHGLQACFIGHLDCLRASELLHLPDHIVCLFLLPVGYPAEDPVARPKLSAEQISFRNHWGE